MRPSPSSHSPWPPGSTHRRSTVQTSSSSTARSAILVEDATSPIDYTYFLPDDILAIIFHHLDTRDRKRCSLVSRRWQFVEGRSRYRLTLKAEWDIFPYLHPMFSRLSSIMKLSLRSDRLSQSINDNGLAIISAHCPRLMHLKLRGCNNITEIGMEALAHYCKHLKKFSCGSCLFGVQAINALLNNCTSLKELAIKRLHLHNFNETRLELIGPGAVALSLKCIHLIEVDNCFFFEPLIAGSKKLQSLKLISCTGAWDNALESVAANPDNRITEVHLERVHVSDIGLSALSNCPRLQVLHVAKTPDCTDAGVTAVVESCHYLKRLRIHGWKWNRIGDDALTAIGKHLVHLKQLILIGVNPTTTGFREIALNCKKLERLSICDCDTVSDREVLSIAFNCVALESFSIRSCPVNDLGIQAFAYGCPNLMRIKVKECKYVSGGIGEWLQARRGSLEVYLDDDPESIYATTSESDAEEEEPVMEVPPTLTLNHGVDAQPDPVEVLATLNHSVDVQLEPVEVLPTVINHGVDAQPEPLASNSNPRSFFKTLFGVFSPACVFGRKSGGNSSSSS